MSDSPQILVKFYDYLLCLIPQVAKFPRNQRYFLGERLENLSLEILEFLLGATYSREKLSYLQKASIKLEQIRFHVRLCKDLKLFNLHRYEVSSKMVNEVGMQLGAWIKQQTAKS
jgi:hypothetical protein